VVITPKKLLAVPRVIVSVYSLRGPLCFATYYGCRDTVIRKTTNQSATLMLIFRIARVLKIKNISNSIEIKLELALDLSI
jgi:hypothetical protein